jgi:hypothetical protein
MLVVVEVEAEVVEPASSSWQENCDVKVTRQERAERQSIPKISVRSLIVEVVVVGPNTQLLLLVEAEQVVEEVRWESQRRG